MYGKIMAEWREQVKALELAITLNSDSVAAHLTAQVAGYELAIRSLEGKASDLSALKVSVTLLEDAYCTLSDAGRILKRHDKELSTIAGTVSVCIATLRRLIPKEVSNNE